MVMTLPSEPGSGRAIAAGGIFLFRVSSSFLMASLSCAS